MKDEIEKYQSLIRKLESEIYDLKLKLTKEKAKCKKCKVTAQIKKQIIDQVELQQEKAMAKGEYPLKDVVKKAEGVPLGSFKGF